jgi:uncharacterized delta-60 repeat protein
MHPRANHRAPALRRIAVAALLGALVAASGCALVLGFEDTKLRAEDGEGGTTPDAGPDVDVVLPDSGPSRLTTNPAAPVLRRGATADLVVEIARGSDVTGVVTATLSDLPVGVTATTAMLTPPATTATLKLTAAANATLGIKTIKLTAGGTTLPPASIPLLVADPAGKLDITFDSDGFLADPSRGPAATFFAVAVQPDQRIVAAGAAGLGGAQPLNGWIVRRYSAAGVPDTAFNTATAAGLPADGEIHAIAVDAMGRIVCVGVSDAPLKLTIVRMSASGAIDKTFGGPTGIVRLPVEVAQTTSFGLGVAVQADGKVIAVGVRRDLANAETGIITRFNDNGLRDPMFNAGATIAVPGTRFVGAAVDATGVLVAGSTIGGALPSYVITRRTAAGAVDPTFGANGTASFGNTYRATGFARLADGSIALVGDVQQGTPGYTAGLASPKGTSVFARGYGNSPAASFFGIAIQADNRIVASGHTAVANGEARVERLLADGNRDPSFSDAGTAVIEPGGSVNGVDVTLFGAAVQADGRILASGNRTAAGAVIYRLWP